MLKDPMKDSIRNILLPEYKELGFREYRTRSILRELPDFIQIISFIKQRTNWHSINYTTFPLFQPLKEIGFGEPGGSLIKRVGGANHDAARNSMKNALSELNQKAIPLFEATSTISGFYHYLTELPQGSLSRGGSSLFYISIASVKLGKETDAASILSDPVFKTDFWESYLKDFRNSLEMGKANEYLIECEKITKNNLKLHQEEDTTLKVYRAFG